MADPMPPPMRARVLDAIAEIVTPRYGCADCDPSGGCPNPIDCRLEIAERILYVVEREQGCGFPSLRLCG